MEITIEKLVALCFCIACWIKMWLSDGLSEFYIPLVMLFLPLALIWFDDLLGSISGFTARAGYMSESSGLAVRLLGWVFLLGLIGVGIYEMVTGAL